MLLAQTLDARTDTTDLLSRLPDELAAEYARLIPQLDRPEAAAFIASGTVEPAPATRAPHPARGRGPARPGQRWRLVAAIRREPGLRGLPAAPPHRRDARRTR